MSAYLGTSDGVHVLGEGALGLAGEQITAIHAEPGFVLAGSYGNGLFRSEGGAWSRVADGAFRCLSRVGDALLAGIEPGLILRSSDDGVSWQALEGFAALPGRDEWYLPYSPRAGAVRNLHVTGERWLASVEVGGLARSEDGGRSWACAPVLADDDIHHVIAHPDDDALLYVSLGTASLPSSRPEAPLGGIARSRDGGRSWEKVERDYTRATLIPSARPDLLLAGPARRVGHGGRIVVSADQGESWTPVYDGPMEDMVERFAESPDGDAWAICARGRLLRATPGEWQWREVATGVKSLVFLA